MIEKLCQQLKVLKTVTYVLLLPTKVSRLTSLTWNIGRTTLTSLLTVSQPTSLEATGSQTQATLYLATSRLPTCLLISSNPQASFKYISSVMKQFNKHGFRITSTKLQVRYSKLFLIEHYSATRMERFLHNWQGV